MKLELSCIVCGTKFLRKPSEVLRGRNKYCSKKCSIHTALRNRNQTGEKNPNWKGGIRTWKPTTEYLKDKQRVYREKFPDKKYCHSLISDYIRNGWLTKKPCEKCGKEKTEAHHEDYSKPLDINWLCKSCHMKRHKELKKELL